MSSPLAAVVRQYFEEGYAIVPRVVSADLIEELEDHVRWLGKAHPERRPEQFNTFLLRDDPFWVRVIADPRLLDLAEAFIGPHIGLFASQYICKPPHTGYPVHWHQDGAYWPLEPMEVVTLWLAVTRSTPENGCVRVIPRSHLVPVLPTEYDASEPAVFQIRIPHGMVDESTAVDLTLEPGDVSLLHPNIIHGSEPNRSGTWRSGLTIRYIPTTTRILTPEFLWPLHLRGEARPEVNTWRERPRYVATRHMPFRGCEAFV